MLLASKTIHAMIVRVDKKREKHERKILDSQERAFWDLHRPAVSKHKVMVKPRFKIFEYLAYGCETTMSG